MASSLNPHDTRSRHRLGTLLRRDKGRLKEAMHQFQVVLRINLQPESDEFKVVKQALDEVSLTLPLAFTLTTYLKLLSSNPNSNPNPKTASLRQSAPACAQLEQHSIA